jgi:hypothetical protein
MDQVTRLPNFSGAFFLGNPKGCLYDDHVQTGVLTFGVGGNSSTPGGWAMIVIAANGSAINIPGAWVKYGGDDISPVNGNSNHFQVFYKENGRIYYTNKVTTP